MPRSSSYRWRSYGSGSSSRVDNQRSVTFWGMGLMSGTGPLGRAPAGTFNFEVPVAGRALYLEPSPKRVRVVVAGEVIADSRRVLMLHESGHQPVYYFPPDDVRAEFLDASDRHTRCPRKGEASYYTIRVGETVVDAGAWY